MLFPILSLLVGTSVHRTVARTKRNGIFIAIAAIFVLTAYALGVTAGAIWLAGIYGPVGAALVSCRLRPADRHYRDDRHDDHECPGSATRERRKQAFETAAAASLGMIRSQPLLTAGVIAAHGRRQSFLIEEQGLISHKRRSAGNKTKKAGAREGAGFSVVVFHQIRRRKPSTSAARMSHPARNRLHR
jgi:hypothetical protein